MNSAPQKVKQCQDVLWWQTVFYVDQPAIEAKTACKRRKLLSAVLRCGGVCQHVSAHPSALVPLGDECAKHLHTLDLLTPSSTYAGDGTVIHDGKCMADPRLP